MKTTLTVIIAGAFVAASAWAVANSQEPEKQVVFEPFNTWQKAQYGATSLINPGTAERAKVLYSYNPNNLVGKSAELGSVTIAKQGQPNTWHPVSEAEGSAIMSSITAGQTVPQEYRVLTQKMVPGADGQQVIAWPPRYSVVQ
jgi:hypothetical protein